MKINGKKASEGLLCRLNERCNLEIAQQNGIHPSIICGEFRRNTVRRGPTAGCFSAKNAHRKTMERHAHKAKALQVPRSHEASGRSMASGR